MALLFTNNASTLMSGSISVGGTTLVVSAGTGELFPAPTGSDYFYLTLYEKDESANDTRIEIAKCTARVADTLTIERDAEGTVGVSGGYGYPSEVGKTVYIDLRMTAGGADHFAQKASNLSDLASAATARTNLGLAIGTDVQAHSAVLDATTASFTIADETKLDGIEAGATADQVWGDITGTLSDQTDLQNALDAKENAGVATAMAIALGG